MAITDVNAAESDGSHPSFWIELGGQLERISAGQELLAPPFLTKTPVPAPFNPVSPIDAQKPPKYGFGGEAKIVFQPERTNWSFSAAVRYGRSNGDKLVHKQTHIQHAPKYIPGFPDLHPTTGTLANFAETKAENRESHVVVDFQAGKDVGLGLFGGGTSTMRLGVRFAQFTSKSDLSIYARPDLRFYNQYTLPKYVPKAIFHAYTAFAHEARSFHGLGPSLSWDASAPVLGSSDATELVADWGINAALLFGRQKADVHHQTTARYFRELLYSHVQSDALVVTHYNKLYSPSVDRIRTHSVIVPNLGGFVGASLKFPNARVSFGYRADFFFGAMDGGIDDRNAATVGFHGPFATISIGLGG